MECNSCRFEADGREKGMRVDGFRFISGNVLVYWYKVEDSDRGCGYEGWMDNVDGSQMGKGGIGLPIWSGGALELCCYDSFLCRM